MTTAVMLSAGPNTTRIDPEPRRLSTLEQGAIEAALTDMLQPNKWFNICVVTSICKILGRDLTPSARESLSLLHCVHWSVMKPATREAVLEVISELIGCPIHHPSYPPTPVEPPLDVHGYPPARKDRSWWGQFSRRGG